MTIAEFCEQRFLRYHAVAPSTRQEYGYTAENHIIPYIGHLRISEVNRETFFNLLIKVLPVEEASQVRYARHAWSSRPCAKWHSTRGYRNNNPIRRSAEADCLAQLHRRLPAAALTTRQTQAPSSRLQEEQRSIAQTDLTASGRQSQVIRMPTPRHPH